MDQLKPLVFKLGSQENGEYFTVPPESFLFEEVDPSTDQETCHLAIIGQNFNNLNYWVLGDTFLQNYYSVFDASGTPQVGITLERGSIGQIGLDKHTTLVYAIAITMVVLLAGIFCSLVILYLFRQREKRRGKHMADLLSRKDRLEGDDDDESSDEEVESNSHTINTRKSKQKDDPNHYTGL